MKNMILMIEHWYSSSVMNRKVIYKIGLKKKIWFEATSFWEKWNSHQCAINLTKVVVEQAPRDPFLKGLSLYICHW